MRMDFNISTTQPVAILSHKDERLSFAINVFTKTQFEVNPEIFQVINDYWAEQPGSTQDAIFGIYKKVAEAFEFSMPEEELYAELNEGIKALLHYHPLERLRIWLLIYPGVMTPETVKAGLPDPSDNTKTVGKTYTEEDYYPLLAMTLFFRTLIPIWGQYVQDIRQSLETCMKEYRAVQLLIGTGILECPAMLRLRRYIDETTQGSQGGDNDRILSGFSSEDISFLTMALVCVRRLSVADLRGDNKKTQPVAYIYKYLAQKMFNSPDSKIEFKTIKKEKEGEAEKHSVLESYRRREEISFGECAKFEYFMSDYQNVAQLLEPGIDPVLVESCVESARGLDNQRIGDLQLFMAGWVLKNVISPYAPFFLEKKSSYTAVDRCLQNSLAVVEAVLWHRGFRYLASLATSYMVVSSEELTIGSISSKEQLSPELAKELKQYYPYEWGTSKKASGSTNFGIVESINHIVDDLLMHSWRMTMAKDKIFELYKDHRRKFIVASDIKDSLARLNIDIEKR